MRRRLLTAAAVALAISAAGCEFDLTPVQVVDRARLSIHLQVTGRGGPLDVTAHFHPGAVSGGHLRSPVDDSLRLDGVAIAPEQVHSGGTRVYRISGLPASTASLRFVPPRIVGVSEEPPEVTTRPVAVVAPDTILTTRNGMIEIDLSGIDGFSSAGVGGWWNVEVHAGSCDSADVLTVSSHTTPPPVIEIAANLLPPDFAAGHLDVEGFLRQETSSVEGSYEVLVFSEFRACVPLRVTG